MKHIFTLSICLLFGILKLNAQTGYNPYISNLQFSVPPSASGYLCGTTQNVQFTQGISTIADATQWLSNPLTITICVTGFQFNGPASSIVSGTYASNFTWAFDSFAPNCLIGTQNQILPGIGTNPLAPNPLASGTINLSIKVPDNTALNTNLGVSVNLQVPGYMTSSNIQSDDNGNLLTVGYCSCYTYITNAGSISGNQYFYTSGNPVAFTSVIAASGGSGGSILYQWQELISGNWTDISGATSITYDAPLITTSKSYRRNAKRSSCGGWISTSLLNVIITIPNAGPDKSVNCTNPSTTIGTTAIAGHTYSWSPATGLNSTTVAQPTANPILSQTYTMTMTDPSGNTAIDIVVVTSSKTIPILNTTITQSTVCAGLSTNITATGASTYTWSPGSLSGATVSVAPTSTTTYTVTGTGLNGCTNTSTRIVNVNPLPLVGSTATSSSICPGGSTTLTGTGANTYTWDFGATFTSSITVSPMNSTTYSVIGTNTATGCTNISSRYIIVNPQPVLNVSSTSNSICSGSNTSITCTGAATYSWMPGSLTGTTIIVNPASTTTYTVTGTNVSGCTSTSTKSITVTNCGTTLNLKLFIEGYYISSSLMNAAIYNELVSGATSNMTDSITVELRNTLSPYSVVESTKTILSNTGNATCNFASTGSYYIVVKHREGLQTWSSNPVTISSITNYDFTTASSKAYGNNMTEVETGIWAFYGGDVNQDGNIDLIDLGLIQADTENFASGYLPTDINGDGNIDLLDASIAENNMNNFIYSVHP